MVSWKPKKRTTPNSSPPYSNTNKHAPGSFPTTVEVRGGPHPKSPSTVLATDAPGNSTCTLVDQHLHAADGEILGGIPEILCQRPGARRNLGIYFRSYNNQDPIRLWDAGPRSNRSTRTGPSGRNSRRYEGVQRNQRWYHLEEWQGCHLTPHQSCPVDRIHITFPALRLLVQGPSF